MQAFADDAILAAGFDYWLNLPRPAGIPDRGDVDPSRMPKPVLPYVALLEVLDGGADARYRLAGQEFNENFGANLKGKKTTDLTEGEYQDYILGHLRTLVDKRPTADPAAHDALEPRRAGRGGDGLQAANLAAGKDARAAVLRGDPGLHRGEQLRTANRACRYRLGGLEAAKRVDGRAAAITGRIRVFPAGPDSPRSRSADRGRGRACSGRGRRF